MLSRPLRARIFLENLQHNLQQVRLAAPNAKIWSVIKANAYGHGQWRVVGALRAHTDGFALLECENAVALREAGCRLPLILLEGIFNEHDAKLALTHQITVVVHSVEQLDLLRAVADKTDIFHIALKFNTGMNRLGLCEKNLPTALEKLTQIPKANIALLSHFADADGDRGVDWQMDAFNRMRHMAIQRLPSLEKAPVSLANSAAILRYPQSHANWVRPGIMLYGGSPFQGVSAASLDLKPAMSLESQIIAIQHLEAGDRLGYGGTFEATSRIRVGIVACGYADGYPRHAPTGTPIAVCGKKTRTLGRVSMDMIFCDLTGIDEAGIGAPVTLWGDDGQGGAVAADDVATAAGTISYELFCALAPRVPREAVA